MLQHQSLTRLRAATGDCRIEKGGEPRRDHSINPLTELSSPDFVVDDDFVIVQNV